MQLVWFQGLKWVKELLQKSQIFIVAGKPSMYGYSLQLVHPDIEIATNDEGTGTHPLMPVYHTTEKSKSKGITSKTFARLTDTLLKQLPAYLPETLPTGTVAKFHLPSIGLSIQPRVETAPFGGQGVQRGGRAFQQLLSPTFAFPPHQCTKTGGERDSPRHENRQTNEPTAPRRCGKRKNLGGTAHHTHCIGQRMPSLPHGTDRNTGQPTLCEFPKNA